MDNSDDYFTDDLILDEQTLAVLEQEENKYLTQIQPTPKPPPTKRQKVDNGWRPGLGGRQQTLEDLDELPEISLQGDGTYGVRGLGFVPPGLRRNASATRLDLINAALASAHNNDGVPPNAHSRASSSSTNHSHSQNRYQPHKRQTSNGQSSRHVSVPRSTPVRNPGQIRASSRSSTLETTSVDDNDLRQKLEELQAENLKIQAALKEAKEIKLAKEGEVSILRKGMEKTAQEHAAQVAKLKAAKEEADAKQAQTQREMKEELERLRTSFMFKQHELETSARKPPLSVHARRIGKDPPPTPIRTPSQMRGWQAGPSMFAADTPRRLQTSTPFRDSPKRVRKLVVPTPAKRPAMLPGFENAFLASSPSRPSRKGKERETSLWDVTSNLAEMEDAPLSSPLGTRRPQPISPPSSPLTARQHRAGHVDVSMDDDPDIFADNANINQGDDTGDIEMTSVETPDEELDEIEPIDWKEETFRIILTHRLLSSASLTLQTLLRTLLPSSTDHCMTETYLKSCSSLLAIFASPSKCNDYDLAVAVLTELVEMVHILHETNTILPLIALLNLLTLLVSILPTFSSVLLCQQHTHKSGPRIVVLLASIIKTRLPPEKQPEPALVNETLGLLEALCWNCTDDLEDKIAYIPRAPGLLSTLLHPSQPSSLLSRTTRFLVFLASHEALCRPLLSFPDVEDLAGSQEAAPDYSKIPHIETMCSFLIDFNRRDPDAESTRINILLFIATMSFRPDAINILVESHTLIPSVVLFLTQLTTPIWEEDEEFMTSSPEVIASTARTVNQTVFLLHQLLLRTEPTNLRYKLQHAPHRPFNGITHMFIVTFGRLGYSDTPEWIDTKSRQELEMVGDAARDLLELVVEGPEGESVWNAYQGSVASEIDEEEAEARRMGEVNDIS